MKIRCAGNCSKPCKIEDRVVLEGEIVNGMFITRTEGIKIHATGVDELTLDRGCGQKLVYEVIEGESNA